MRELMFLIVPCVLIEKNEMGHGEAGWWMLQFRNADVDRNGTLDFDEFNK